jgi:RecA/RadA recombinase
VIYDPILHKIPTASSIINIAGCGGLDFSSMTEVWGAPKGGKSTFCYQTAQAFLREYGDSAMLLILDAENSANALRLLKVFGIGISNHPHVRVKNRDPRVFIEPAFTFESVVEILARYVNLAKKDGKFLLVVWDSVTVTRPAKEKELFDSVIDAQLKEANEEALTKEDKEALKNGVGRKMNIAQLRPQMLKWALNQLMSSIYLQPVHILMINQATTQFGAKETSGGGYGFKHNIHYSIRFNFIKKLGENPLFHTGTFSKMSVEKSKVMPALDDIEVFIRDDQGGRLEPNMELIKAAIASKVMDAKSGGWYSVGKEYLPAGSPLVDVKTQLKDFDSKPDMIAATTKAMEQHFRTNFQLLNWAYEERLDYLKELGIDGNTGEATAPAVIAKKAVTKKSAGAE